ncbi:MAG: PAS domain S-box protein [Alphaproteobacteria bacterium]
MPTRYTDMDLNTNGASDFVVRQRQPAISHVVSIIFIVLMIAISTAVFVADKYLLTALLVTILGMVGWYIVIQVQRNHDLLLATEFQNALFASALGLNNKFCIIIRRDGNIVYLDRAFQEMFPDFLKQSRRTLDVLLEQGRVEQDEVNRIFSAIEQGVYEKVVFNIRGAGKKYYKIVMSVEPIMRPSGFIMLRGREFVEKRNTFKDDNTNPILSESTITLFSHVMDTMNMGIYMTDPSGNIIYANPVLENWLGFEPGEIVSMNMGLGGIINHNQPDSTHIEPEDFEGEVRLNRKIGGYMKAFINQKVMRNTQDKIMGCTAIIHNFSDHEKEIKKKLW